MISNTMYYIIAYRESGPISQCPTPFPTLELARECAELAALHFGPDYTVAVEEGDDEDELEQAGKEACSLT